MPWAAFRGLLSEHGQCVSLRPDFLIGKVKGLSGTSEVPSTSGLLRIQNVDFLPPPDRLDASPSLRLSTLIT